MVEIRPLGPGDDIIAVSEVYRRSWQTAYRGIVPDSFLDRIPAMGWVNTLLKPELCSLLLLKEGELIGTSACCASREPELSGWGEIVSVYLLPEHTGRGYGKGLLSAALAELQGRGFDNVFLWVLRENSSARRFYESCGFTPNGRVMEDDYDGKTLQLMQYVYSFEKKDGKEQLP